MISSVTNRELVSEMRWDEMRETEEASMAFEVDWNHSCKRTTDEEVDQQPLRGLFLPRVSIFFSSKSTELKGLFVNSWSKSQFRFLQKYTRRVFIGDSPKRKPFCGAKEGTRVNDQKGVHLSWPKNDHRHSLAFIQGKNLIFRLEYFVGVLTFLFLFSKSRNYLKSTWRTSSKWSLCLWEKKPKVTWGDKALFH